MGAGRITAMIHKYVSNTNGDDGNIGDSPAVPCKTIKKVIDLSGNQIVNLSDDSAFILPSSVIWTTFSRALPKDY